MKQRKYQKTMISIFLIVLVGLTFTMIMKPYYRVENRQKKINNFNIKNHINPLGWLRVQGTNIDFPIVYYNDTDVTEPKYELGWNYSEDRKLTKRVTIFSHNVLNVSSTPLITDKNHKRFEQLLSFIYTDFVKKNKYIQYTIGNKNYLYKIYGISFQEEEKLDYENTKINRKEAKKYIKKTLDDSYFKFDVDVKETDHLITLVTCTRFFGNTTKYSFVVDARMVIKNESIKNYQVTEKKNYKKIKKTLEGDVEDEKI